MLWLGWAIPLALVAAWAWPLHVPLVAVPSGQSHFKLANWTIGWANFVAVAGAGLTIGFGITYTTWRRRMAERSERISAAEQTTAGRLSNHPDHHNAVPRVSYTVKEKLSEYREEQKEMDLRLRETMAKAQSNRRLAICALVFAGGRELWPYLLKLL